MKELKGISVSQGIAIGRACIYKLTPSDNVSHYQIPENKVDAELRRLESAFSIAEKKIKKLDELSGELIGHHGKEIVSAHLSILNDSSIRDRIRKRIKEKLNNAEHAISDIMDEYVDKLSSAGLHFEEISHDVIDIKHRLIESISGSGSQFECPIGEREAVIVVSEVLTPSMVLKIPRENVLGFITKKGGYTSHATIIAKTFGVPILFGIDIGELTCNCSVILDANHGKAIVSPDEDTMNEYRRLEAQRQGRLTYCNVKSLDPPQTAEGTRINLKVNISTFGEIELLKDNISGANTYNINYDGIGLLRTEFLFINSDYAPDEEVQYSAYYRFLEAVGDKPVVMRMLDISPDKRPSYIENLIGNKEDVRGSMAIDALHDIYLTQTRALLRAASKGNIKILFPMVADLDDVSVARRLLDEACCTLKKDSKDFRVPPLGIMFETPSSAMLSDSLLKEVDFANIGTNDLLQYSVAASRDSLISKQSYHIMHPSILKMIKMIVEAGIKNDKEICLCGELSSFENFYPVLLDIGLRSFSVQASKYEDIKCELLHIKEKDYLGQSEKYLELNSRDSQDLFFSKGN